MDSGTMVRAVGDEMGTVRVASTMTDGANTMIEHDDTLPSQLGTMVINTEDEEEEGTMKSKAYLSKSTDFSDQAYIFQRRQILMVYAGLALSSFFCHNQRSRKLGGLQWGQEVWGRGKLTCGVKSQESINSEKGF